MGAVILVLAVIYFNQTVNKAMLAERPGKKTPARRELNSLSNPPSMDLKKQSQAMKKATEAFIIEDEETVREVLMGRYDSFMESQIDQANFARNEGRLDEKLSQLEKGKIGKKNQMKIIKRDPAYGSDNNIDDLLAQPALRFA